MESIGEKIAPVLEEIENIMVAHVQKGPLEIPNYGLRAAITILTLSILDKSWELMEEENIPQANREEMGTSIGNELRALIHKYTGIDTHVFYK